MIELLGTFAWMGALVVVLGTVAIAVIALRLHQPVLALAGTVPVLIGILLILFRVSLPGSPVLVGLVGLAFAALGIVGGNPITVWVLARAAKTDVDAGSHGGILLPAPATTSKAAATAPPREVLRGGTWIGYLERLAVIGAVALGHYEIVAAVIAIKGLGRFSELDAPETRERFIIGTLVSMIWAALCAAVVVLPGLLF